MTFFYDLNKRMAALAGRQELAESKKAKPDFLDADKDGDKNEPMKKALKDAEKKVNEAAKPDFLDVDKDGNKKESFKKAVKDKDLDEGRDEGKPGKTFAKIAKSAGERYGSKAAGERVAGAVRAKLAKQGKLEEEELDEGFKELDAWMEKRKKEAGTGNFDKKQISTGTVYTRKHKEEPDDEDTDAPTSKGGKPKGRKTVGAGKGKKIGAKVKGTSKLHSKGSIAENDHEMISLLDKGEYDQEGDMAKKDLKSIAMAAKELHAILGDNQNLPEWVQSKITKALDYINSSNQYMHQEQGDKVVAEKAVSQQQQKFMGMAHAMQKGEKIKGASPELKKVAKTMKKSDVTDFAKTKRNDLPKKVKDGEPVKEEGQETTKKSKGGIQFGKGIYESMNSKLENIIAEGMNVSINMSVGDDDGRPTKNITVSAEGAEAEALAQLLNLAGMQSQESDCGCGQTPCGCDQVEEAYGDTKPTENTPDYPTDEETTGEDDELLRRWAGGLNKPKSTGQTTAPVVNRDPARGSFGTKEMAESTDLGMSLYAELKQFKGQ